MDDDTTVFLLTGIARPQPLVNYIRQYTSRIIHHKYPDHHLFSLKNITKLAQEFSACQDQKKIIVTTEKDVQRLEEQELQRLVTALPVYTLPINVMFLNNGHAQFNKLLENYVREYTTHHRIH